MSLGRCPGFCCVLGRSSLRSASPPYPRRPAPPPRLRLPLRPRRSPLPPSRLRLLPPPPLRLRLPPPLRLRLLPPPPLRLRLPPPPRLRLLLLPLPRLLRLRLCPAMLSCKSRRAGVTFAVCGKMARRIAGETTRAANLTFLRARDSSALPPAAPFPAAFSSTAPSHVGATTDADNRNRRRGASRPWRRGIRTLAPSTKRGAPCAGVR